jgi:eukaryotic-like serine/threonine-protein kinase
VSEAGLKHEITPERWQQIERLYHSALELDSSQRRAYLQQACAGDEVLREEVESLVAHGQTTDALLDHSALGEMAAEILAKQDGRSLVGTKLGSYQVLTLLGVGGMGEVYQAHDNKLRRDVAIKVLPAAFMNDADRLARFEREARMLAALNHPNIAAIYGLEQSDGVHYLVMELVPGQTLAERVSAGPLAMKEALALAGQIAEALEAAHEKGVIHRDLKPSNVKVTPGGRVKVLDFGLAKALTEGDEQNLSQALTLTALSSEQGRILGTPAYMSPEQARGQRVDEQTDIWAFGCVLYELLTTKCAFRGATLQDTLAAVLEREPDWQALPPSTPEKIRNLLRRCLQKDPQRRLQDLGDARIEIEEAPAAQPQPRWRSRAAPWIAAAFVILLTAAGWLNRFAARGDTIDSVAVLPFANASGDPNTDYLSQGIAGTIVNRLSQLQLPNLRVVPWSTVSRYAGRQVDPQEVGRALNVRAVLAGTVIQRGDSLNIEMELVDIKKVSQLWGQQYQRKLADILPLQEQIATDISNKLRLRLNAEQEQRLTRHYTENSEAQLLYLKGRSLMDEKTAQGLQKAAQYFQQAIAIDPNYALAYAGLASSDVLLVRRGASSPTDTYLSAKSGATKALAIDDTLADAHVAQGVVKTDFDRDWPTAEEEFKRAITLAPTLVEAHHQYSHFLEAMGRSEESLSESQRALEIDPLDPVISAHLGWHYVMARRPEQAIVQCQKALEVGNTYWGHFYLGQAYEQKARYNEAIAEFNKALGISEGSTEAIAALGHAYAVSGKRREAQHVLDDLDSLSKRQYVSLGYKAIIYAGLGDKEQAFKWLQYAYEEGSGWLIYLNVDPRYDPLRSDPRFQTLLHSVNLQR